MFELLMGISNKDDTPVWTFNPKWKVSLREPALAVVNGLIITMGGSRLQEGSEPYADYTYPNTLITYNIADGVFTRSTTPLLGRSNTYAVGIGDKFYMLGGYTADGSQVFNLYEYNTSTSTWTSRTPPSSTYSATSMVAHNGYLYATFYDTSAKLTKLCRWTPFNPNNFWVPMTSLPDQKYHTGRLLSFGGYIYYFGGRKAGGLATVVYRYNVGANNWTLLQAMPTGFDDVYPTSSNNSMYLLKASLSTPLQIYKYVDNGQPVFVATSPEGWQPTTRFGMTTWNNKTYIIGGVSTVAPTGLSNQSVTLELK